ncbi:MAG: hypothetical protein V3U11_02080, partial [Planctomycetota bacterium]
MTPNLPAPRRPRPLRLGLLLSLPALSLPALLILAGCSTQEPEQDPRAEAAAATVKTTVVDDYHGFKVADPYRWLEDPDAPRTQTWITAQNRVTEAFVAKVEDRERIRKRLQELWSYERFWPPMRQGPSWYYFHNSGLQNQRVMYRAAGLDQDGTVFLDPNTLSQDGTVALGGLSFSEDGRYLAYSYSQSGSDWREWKVIDTSNGQHLGDHVTWTKFTGATWDQYGSGFFYQRYPKPEQGKILEQVNKTHSLCYHKLGT